jgi:hypothetical protein
MSSRSKTWAERPSLTPHRNDASVSRLPSVANQRRSVIQTSYTLCQLTEDIRSTPEEAARGDIPARFVQVVGVVVRGDTAVLAQLTNDAPPYEVETAYCHREGDGWVEGSSGNSTSGYLPTGEGIGTVVVWDEAPATAVSARFEYNGREQVVPVERGCALAVFDDVKEEDAYVGGPSLVAWIDAGGAEQELLRFDPPEWVRAKLRKYMEREP